MRIFHETSFHETSSHETVARNHHIKPSNFAHPVSPVAAAQCSAVLCWLSGFCHRGSAPEKMIFHPDDGTPMIRQERETGTERNTQRTHASGVIGKVTSRSRSLLFLRHSLLNITQPCSGRNPSKGRVDSSLALVSALKTSSHMHGRVYAHAPYSRFATITTRQWITQAKPVQPLPVYRELGSARKKLWFIELHKYCDDWVFSSRSARQVSIAIQPSINNTLPPPSPRVCPHRALTPPQPPRGPQTPRTPTAAATTSPPRSPAPRTRALPRHSRSPLLG